MILSYDGLKSRMNAARITNYKDHTSTAELLEALQKIDSFKTRLEDNEPEDSAIILETHDVKKEFQKMSTLYVSECLRVI